MSDSKGSGLFVNKKPSAAKPSAAPVTPSAGAKGPKNVQARWMYIGGAVIGLVILSTSLTSKPDAPSTAVKKQTAMVNTDPPNADKDAFTSKFAKDLEAVKVQQIALEQKLSEKDKEIAELKGRSAKTEAAGSAIPPGIVPPPIAGNSGGLGAVPIPPAPPVAPNSTGGAGVPQIGSQKVVPTIPGATGGGASGAQIFKAPALQKTSEAENTSAAAVASADVKKSYKKNANAGLIPAGAFAPVSLLNGVDAGTASTTQANPLPVLMRINDQATLPGSAKYQLKSCFVLGTAYGDLSAERVYGRISRLSCVDKKDRLVLTQEVQGYLVDSDGKLGLRGMITDRQGTKIGKALLAGFAQGLAGALGKAQTTTTSTVLGTTSTIGGEEALRAAGLSGAENAASQLAQFYLKEASSIFPVITVDAGRTGTIVFSNSATLAWSDGDNQFVQQVQPK